MLPLGFPSVTLLSSRIYGTENRIRVPEPSPLWSHKVAPSVAMWCGVQMGNWLEVISILNGLVISSRQTRSLGQGTGLGIEEAEKLKWSGLLSTLSISQKLFHVDPYHPNVTQSFDDESQDAAGPYPTLVS